MSDSPVPVYVDTRKIFLQQGEIAGFVDLKRLPRFRETLASDKGAVHVALQFTTSDAGQQLILGRLEASVEVICQRCLEPLGIELADDIKLALLADESKSKELDSDLEPWICAEPKLELAGLVEEQLMLCMPIVNYHTTSDCSNKLGYREPTDKLALPSANGTANPFSVLKTLKENDGNN